ncbi:MAG: efflux RND transporter periplasmic adaptor subunit [Planctomycetes bacterium]|nr:efflux RND transporter periplasmic adaptor subunit [Planctomycetota bacterium]MBL7142889.1 efflux RND transporter periplasmic adaptor subunit [Phycisphaerae bacterium]
MTEIASVKQSRQEKPRSVLRMLVVGSIKILLSVLIVAGAIAIYRYQIRTSPRLGRKKPPPQPKLVQVIPVQQDDCTTKVIADGIVMPAKQVTLRPQVTGQIMDLSGDVVPGGIVQAGQKLIEIDHRDYEILVRQRKSDVAKALKDLKVEEGNQAIAKQEYELLGEIISEEDRELVLREPQLASIKAAQESAQAALDKVQLDLIRCDIFTPFNAIIQEKHVDFGATVMANSNLITLIGTDEAWIEVKVWIGQLKWLTIPQKNGDSGSKVTIYNTLAWGAERFRSGRVLCLNGELETQGRMARLLVAVDDPYCLKPENRDMPQLLMGSYISAEIEGRTLKSVYPIKRSHLRDDDTLWLLNDNSQLEIRHVKIVFRDSDQVYINEGLTENEKLVMTDIAAPVEGMPLRIASAEDENEGPGQSQEGKRPMAGQDKRQKPSEGGQR